MEASRVDELVSRAMDEQVAEYRQWRSEAAALAERIERLEAAVEALRTQVAGGLADAARAGVAGEVDRLADDLRRQISDLGRLIVNDLGRLPRLLEQQQSPASTSAAEEPALDLRDNGLPYAHDVEERRGLFRRR
jgi:hypothetical protein